MKKISLLTVLVLAGCTGNQQEIQSLCVGEVVGNNGKYYCVQERNNNFCMINIISLPDGMEGTMINCGTIEPRGSKAFCASKKIDRKTFSNGIIYHCDNTLGNKDILYCDYIIDNKIIVNGVEKNMKMGEIRCASKKNIDMYHNPL